MSLADKLQQELDARAEKKRQDEEQCKANALQDRKHLQEMTKLVHKFFRGMQFKGLTIIRMNQVPTSEDYPLLKFRKAGRTVGKIWVSLCSINTVPEAQVCGKVAVGHDSLDNVGHEFYIFNSSSLHYDLKTFVEKFSKAIAEHTKS